MARNAKQIMRDSVKWKIIARCVAIFFWLACMMFIVEFGITVTEGLMQKITFVRVGFAMGLVMFTFVVSTIAYSIYDDMKDWWL